jgi:cell division protein FtsB
MATVRGSGRVTVESASTRPNRRHRRWGFVLLLLSAIFFGVNFTQEWLTSHQVQQQAANLQAQIAQTNALNQQLQSQIAYFQSKQYIIPEARKLGMTRPGDVLMYVKQLPPTYRVVHVKKAPAPPQSSLFANLLQAIFN